MKGIEFKGKALEYFGIWLTNILLTVVTIGIGLWFGQILINWWEQK